MDELVLQQIVVTQGNIIFNDFERIKAEAIQLAEKIKSVEVDEENVKNCKKGLAAVNNKIKELENERIRIKKTMMEPYTDFENKVKEIVGIVKEADDVVRMQVKALEEAERQTKQEKLEDLFNKRIVHYTFRNLFGFKDFLQARHLNKTASIDSVEKEMIQFLEKLTKDLKVIESLPNPEATLSAYVDSKDLALAMTLVAQEENRRRQIEASQALKQPTEDKIAYLVSVKCHNLKEMKLLEMILQENGFEFTTDKIGG